MAYYGVAYSSRETIDNTKHYSKDVIERNIPGTFVECGVAAGAQIAAMYDVIGSSRWIYGFDSFEGIPLASNDDDQQPGIEGPKPVVPYSNTRELLKSSGITVHSKESVLRNLNYWFKKPETIVLVKGWFQDTLSMYKKVLQHLGGISLLRLDGDLYESTKVSLEELFPLLNPGGILIIDDWLLTGCRKACDEYFETHSVSQITPPFGTEKDGPAYFIKN